MSDRSEKAVDCFKEGFNCSQAVFSTYSGELGVEKETALRAAAGMGGGMGGLGEVCGAVTGAMMAIGLKHGHTEATDKEKKAKTYGRVRDYAGRFKARNGSILCRDLLGFDISTPEGMDQARQQGLFAERCPRFVSDAAEILEDFL